MQYLFQLVLGSKNYTTPNPKNSLMDKTKKHKKLSFLIFNFFLKDYILSIFEALIHSIWNDNEKVMDNLVFWTI